MCGCWLSQTKDTVPMFCVDDGWSTQAGAVNGYRGAWTDTIERELFLFPDARTRDIRKYKGHRAACRFLLCRPIGMAICTWGKAAKAASAFPHLLPFESYEMRDTALPLRPDREGIDFNYIILSKTRRAPCPVHRSARSGAPLVVQRLLLRHWNSPSR
jgi:hypothetical protein